MILREIEVSELGQVFRDVIREELAKLQPPAPKEKELIRRKEARELLGGISDPTIIAYEKKGLLNPIRIGGTILYDRNEILNKSTRG
jgi:hypothetical protein